MKHVYTKIIHYLLDQGNAWSSGNDIATTLGVTPRSIRSYIRALNDTTQVIESSTKGYRLLPNFNNPNVDVKQDEHSPKLRQQLLLNKLLIDRNVNYFDFADEEFVSVSSIEKDILQLRQTLNTYKIQILKSNQILSLEAEELDLRTFIYDTILRESKSKPNQENFVDIIFETSIISTKQDDIIKLDAILTQALSKHKLVLNAYARFNVILHLVIAIERAAGNFPILPMDENNQLILDHPVKQLATDISDSINSTFHIVLNEDEIHYLTLILIPKVTRIFSESTPMNLIYQYINEDVSTLVSTIFDTIESRFLVRYDNRNFLLNFTLHIQNLILRSKSNKSYVTGNPYTKQLKTQSPLTYEFAVFITNEIQRDQNIHISEDEITFIALHLGAYPEQRSKELLKTLIVFPEFHTLHLSFIQKIESKFADSIQIDSVSTSLLTQDILENYDFVISVIELHTTYSHIVHVSPFLEKADFKRIQNKIVDIDTMNKKRKLESKFHHFFSNAFFKKDLYLKDEFEYINYICDDLEKNNLTDATFRSSVIERERMSTTVFCNHVAMPHALLATSKKTGLYVIANKKPTTWGKHRISLILLIAINNDNMEYFSDFFDTLIEVLSNEENIKKLVDSSNYQDFINNLLTVI